MTPPSESHNSKLSANSVISLTSSPSSNYDSSDSGVRDKNVQSQGQPNVTEKLWNVPARSLIPARQSRLETLAQHTASGEKALDHKRAVSRYCTHRDDQTDGER